MPIAIIGQENINDVIRNKTTLIKKVNKDRINSSMFSPLQNSRYFALRDV